MTPDAAALMLLAPMGVAAVAMHLLAHWVAALLCGFRTRLLPLVVACKWQRWTALAPGLQPS